MNATRAAKLLELLDTEAWITSKEVAQSIEKSERTVRSAMRELGDLLQTAGASIESRPRYGYRLQVEDAERYAALCSRLGASTEVPDGVDARVDYLVMGLLYISGYVKINDLQDIFYVSGGTLSSSLKEAEEVFARYNLAIERRPNYGVRVVGREVDARRLIAERFVRNGIFPGELGEDARGRLVEMASEVRAVLAKHSVTLTEFAFESLVDYCLVACSRVRVGFLIDLGSERLPEVSDRVRLAARDLEHALGMDECPAHSLDETRYLELILAGSRTAGGGSNFVISEKTDRITLEALSLLTNDYGLNLLDNFDLRMQLNQHLAPMDIRLRFDMYVNNPLLGEIKANYPLAYQMAALVGEVLSSHYECPIPEDELGFIALILQVAIERGKLAGKHNVLIVSGLGRSSAHLLRSGFEQHFGDYLDTIYLCDPFGLENFDFSTVDYIFTTAPITMAVPKPVIEIDPFLDKNDVRAIEEALATGAASNYVDTFVTPARMLFDFEGATRVEVLQNLCGLITSRERVSDSFTSLVFQREEYAQMHLGSGVALPHPSGIASEETFAYVVLLKNAVDWHGEQVRVVLLVSGGPADADEEGRRGLNEALAKFALDKGSVDAFVSDPSYELFCDLLEA